MFCLAACLGGLLQLAVDGGAVGLDVVDAPEVEAAHLVGFELFGERDGALEHFVLLLEADLLGAVQVFLGAVLGDGRAGPVHLVERAADIGDLRLYLARIFCASAIWASEIDLQVLAPDLAQLDVVKAEVLGDDVAGVIEVLRDLVGDDADLELRVCRRARTGNKNERLRQPRRRRMPSREMLICSTSFTLAL